MGGLNTITAGSEMPPTDAVVLWNLVAAELGLRTRLGTREWCTGLTGAADDKVRMIIPFTGSAHAGTSNKLFATTSSGIWDVTDSSAACAPPDWSAATAYTVGQRVTNDTGKVYECDTAGTSDASGGPTGAGADIADNSTRWDYIAPNATPSPDIAFPVTTGDAGYGVFHVVVTQGGHFLYYCDEVNGLYVYTQSTGYWVKVLVGATVAWTINTVYIVGDRVTNDSGKQYTCTTGGTSAGSGGPTGTGPGISDGSVTWSGVAAFTATMGPTQADRRLGFTADPGNFAFVTIFKNRPFFVEKNTARAYYLTAGTLYGTLTRFEFATKFKSGGDLVGLWNWTYDGGSGMDDSLVGVSSGGDVVIYQGTDPDSASTFRLQGVWGVGAMPKGRDIVTNRGGDVFLLTRTGALPLSELVSGKPLDTDKYATAKIHNLINALMLSKASMRGWSLRTHPEDNSLIITVPTTDGANTEQLAMSLSRKSWGRYRDLPILSCESWVGKLYYGTDDGVVGINDGYVDGVTLADPSAYTPITFSGIGSFQGLGNGNQKQVQMIRPLILSDSAVPNIRAEARYRYNMTEIQNIPLATLGDGGWDGALWDADVWSGDYAASQPVYGAAGMGTDFAIAFKGTVTTRCVIVGFDVSFTQGGFL
jgi:hypothetical protein